MAPMTYLDTLLRSSTTFIADSLQAAPFLPFTIFVLVHILLAPTSITSVSRLCNTDRSSLNFEI
ncbi:hypothetical protein N7527_008812 [Penicillium freii]|nr:hypothetical protein N7527_008812 [Penicillium freii]